MPCPSPDRPVLSAAQVRAFIDHPFINKTAVAEAYYGDGRSRPYAALRKRIQLSSKISLETRRRMTELYDQFIQDTVRAYGGEEE
jgi:hypothetical protein